MTRYWGVLYGLLLTGCLFPSRDSNLSSLVVQVRCGHRPEVRRSLPPDARDWSQTRNILVELIPVDTTAERPSRKVQVSCSPDGLSVTHVCGTLDDTLVLINSSHRPLRLKSLGELAVDIRLDHGHSESISFGRLSDHDVIFDNTGARRLSVTRTRAPVARHVDSHKVESFKVSPGNWTLRLSHELIPPLEIPLVVSSDGITRIEPEFSVGRLPLVQ